MIKLFRVILSLDPREFISGAAQAGQIITGFKSTLDLLRGAFETLTNLARGFWDTFVAGAAAEEKLRASLERVLGSSIETAKAWDMLDEKAQKLGVSSEALQPALIQIATGLKAIDGAVDPAKLDKMLNMVIALQKRYGVDAESAAKAITRALAGDMGLLQRIVGIGLDSIGGLSDQAKEMLGDVQAAGDESLGNVTSVLAGKEKDAEASLETLDEIFAKLGLSAEEGSDTVDANLTKIEERFENLKERVGDRLLPIINRALDKFITWFDENEPTINRFVDSVADALGRLGEGALDALLESLTNFDPSAFDELIDGINSVEWQDIADAMNSIAGAIKTIGDISTGFDRGITKDDKDYGQGVGGIANKISDKGASPEGTDFFSNILKNLGIDITISVDEEGQLNVKKVAEKTAGDMIDEFANNVSKGGNNRRGGR